MNSTISISIADAMNITRNAIKHYLNSIAGFQVIFDTGTGDQLLLNLEDQQPSVCIIEALLPDTTGLDVLLKIRERTNGNTKVLILSSYNSPILISKFLRTGASGYILKQESPDSLKDAIQHISTGGTYIPKPLMRQISRMNNINAQYDTMSISKKEYLFLSYCNSELTYKEIASKMFISPRTLEGYRDNLFKKLNVKSRIGLALYAAKSGISLIN